VFSLDVFEQLGREEQKGYDIVILFFEKNIQIYLLKKQACH
jgi:hypothetical protein